MEVGAPAIGDIFHKVKLDLGSSKKILDDIETIVGKLSV
jgi:hypothetical protein